MTRNKTHTCFHYCHYWVFTTTLLWRHSNLYSIRSQANLIIDSMTQNKTHTHFHYCHYWVLTTTAIVKTLKLVSDKKSSKSSACKQHQPCQIQDRSTEQQLNSITDSACTEIGLNWPRGSSCGRRIIYLTLKTIVSRKDVAFENSLTMVDIFYRNLVARDIRR